MLARQDSASSSSYCECLGSDSSCPCQAAQRARCILPSIQQPSSSSNDCCCYPERPSAGRGTELPNCGCGTEAPCKVGRGPTPVSLLGKLDSSEESQVTGCECRVDSADDKALDGADQHFSAYQPHAEWAAAQKIFKRYRKTWPTNQPCQVGTACDCLNYTPEGTPGRLTSPTRKPFQMRTANVQEFERLPVNCLKPKRETKYLVPRRVTYIPNEKLFMMQAKMTAPKNTRRLEVQQTIKLPKMNSKACPCVPPFGANVCTRPMKPRSPSPTKRPAYSCVPPYAIDNTQPPKRSPSPRRTVSPSWRKTVSPKKPTPRRVCLPICDPPASRLHRRPSGKIPINILNFVCPPFRREVKSLPVRLCS